MTETINVANIDKVHKNPIAELVQTACQFESHIDISSEGKNINAKSLMGIMAFGLRDGMSVTISAEGNEKKDGNVFGGAVKTAEVKAAEAKTTVKKTAKKAAAKTETAKKAVETAAAKAETKVEAKVEEAKETVKEAAKTTTKKVAAKKTAVRTTAKKAVAKKEAKTETFIQYNDEQTDMDAVLKRVEADLKAQKVAAKDIKLYIKPQDGACYYVADGKVAGRVDLF